MSAAVSGKFKLVGSPHWTSGPLAFIPVAQHQVWGEQLTKADSVVLGKMKKRVVVGEMGGVYFPLVGVAGYFQNGPIAYLVEARDEAGRAPVPIKPVLEAANQVEVEDKAWKQVATYKLDGPHVLWNAYAKDLQGEGIRERKGGIAVPFAHEDYVVEEIKGVKFAVKAFPNKKPVDVTYTFTRLRPASAQPVASKPAKAKLPPVPSELVATPEVIKAGKALRFADSDQTAMVIMPRAALPSWSGLDDEGKDYWRACAVKTVGLIPVSGSTTKALAVGMDSAMSFFPTGNGGLVLMWVGADTAVGLLALALSIPDKQWKKTKVTWDVGDGKLVMIGAPTVGKKAGKRRVDITLEPGRYRVETCWGFAGDVRVGKKAESVGISALRIART